MFLGIYQNHAVTITNNVNERSRTNSNVTQPTVQDQNSSTLVNRNEYHNSLGSHDRGNVINDSGESTGPYIPISECITGVRAQVIKTYFNNTVEN